MCIRDSVQAALAQGAAHTAAALAALAVVTKGLEPTLHVRTRIIDTREIIADLPTGAAAGVAVVGPAAPLDAQLCAGALDAFAGVAADAVHTHLVGQAPGRFTLGDTEATHAPQSPGTAALEAGLDTPREATHQVVAAEGELVDLSLIHI